MPKYPVLGILAMLVFFAFAIVVVAPVRAITAFDGKYNITYTTIEFPYFIQGRWNVWTTETRQGFLSISNGLITIASDYEDGWCSKDHDGGVFCWTTWCGSVDASGNAQWTGCIVEMNSWNDESNVFTFTGKISSDGTGSGTYTGVIPPTYLDVPNKNGGTITGTWTIQKTTEMGVFFSFLLAIGIVGGIGIPIVAIARTRVKKKRKQGFQPPREPEQGRKWIRDGSKTTIEPQPESQTGAPPPTAPGAEGVSQGGVGLHYGSPPPSPPKLTRTIFGDGLVSLAWNPPEFDAGMYHLEGYEITRQYVKGRGPESVLEARLPPEIREWTGPFKQTSRFRMSGDIEGYNVEALLSYTDNTGYKHILRYVAVAYAPL